ncbi:MAG: glycosyltransferase [Desulfomonilaceae bacterium]
MAGLYLGVQPARLASSKEIKNNGCRSLAGAEFSMPAHNLIRRIYNALPPTLRYHAWRLKRAKDVRDTRDCLTAIPEQTLSFSALSPGLNIIGFFSSVMGLGEAAWSAWRGVSEVGLPAHIVDIPLIDRISADVVLPQNQVNTCFPINVFHFNPDSIRLLMREELSYYYRAARYNIGYWFWETTRLPEYWVEAASLFDEIWTGSQFCWETFAGSIGKPVFKIPLNLYPTAELDQASAREELGLPTDRYIFLTMMDVMSQPERKNPLAALDAFDKAFEYGNKEVCLVVKALNRIPGAHDELMQRCAKHPGIIVIDRALSRNGVNALFNAVDCFMSLHRAEGFGLPIAEAMSLGKPVVATGWSGNMEFMTEENSFPVDYTLKKFDRPALPYPKGGLWAEPNIEHAAAIMRTLVDSPGIGVGVGQRAKADILRSLSPQKTGASVRSRLEEIWCNLK